MGDVVEMDAMRPHLTIQTPEAVHVVPLALLSEVAAGKQPFCRLPESVWRALLGDMVLILTEEASQK